MDRTNLFKEISLQNFLSFGPIAHPLELRPLNVLIGTNASGKSNLIEAFSILKAAHTDISTPFNIGGDGAREWIWKGSNDSIASISVKYAVDINKYLLHTIKFTADFFNRFQLVDEIIQQYDGSSLYKNEIPQTIYHYNSGSPIYHDRLIPSLIDGNQMITPVSPDISTQSVLSRRLDPQVYTELLYLYLAYSNIYLYRGWPSGYDFLPRKAQPPHLPGSFLLEDASNLAMVLNNLSTHFSATKVKIETLLSSIFNILTEVSVDYSTGQGLVYFHEKGLEKPIPAIRVSDGVLRYLCLLTILCHPKPPPIICIDEPEIGLHPDAIIQLAKVLKDASKRTQLIITTHSDILVSQFTDSPESVVVCNRDETGSHMRRLEPDKLQAWLKDEYLGDVWLSGGLGGTL